MTAFASSRLWQRLKPAEGWLALGLTAVTLAVAIASVLEVGWVREDGVVVVTAVFGFGLALVLAKRPLRAPAAWGLLTLYGLFITLIDLADLWYRPELWSLPWPELRQHWLEQGALFGDRVGGWLQAVAGGGRSQETMPFALGLGLLAWFLSAYLGWSTFRQKRPLLGLSVLALAVALNGYFGAVPAYWMALFVGLSAVVTAVYHFLDMESRWQHAQIDFSDEIRTDMMLYASGIALVLVTLSLLLPAIPAAQITNDVLVLLGVREAEATLERVFAGVSQPRGASAGSVGGSGTLPRSFLLGAAPDLLESVVMTATAATTNNSHLRGIHWRGLSYVTYTGRGWTLAEERQEAFAANQPLPLPPAAAQVTITQTVQWQADNRVIRYSLGMPLLFDQDVVAAWLGLNDLTRVFSEGSATYGVTSRVSGASPAALRQTILSDVPPTILARYTQLPAELPPRVAALANEVAGSLDNPYDQARALELFLRQYPYSLDVPLPPSDQDPVDYFLFDLQIGYCDYYASSMAVMARTLGLPARIAVGFVQPPPDRSGVQIVRQVHSHSWTEIYFAGYGWVEFEPTAPFASAHSVPADTAVSADTPPAYDPPYPDTPPPPADTGSGSLAARLVVIGLAAALLVFVWWRQRQPPPAELDGVARQYGRLQHIARQLGQPVPASQTPLEFEAALTARLAALAAAPWWGQRVTQRLVTAVSPPARQLIGLYGRYRYRGEAIPDDQTMPMARALGRAGRWLPYWQRLRRRPKM